MKRLIGLTILLTAFLSVSTYVQSEEYALQVKLTWEQEGADLDLYVFNPAWRACYWNSPETAWGCRYDYDSLGGSERRERLGESPDNFPYEEQASVDLDKFQENPGAYRVGVYHYNRWSDAFQEVVHGTVEVYLHGELVGVFPIALEPNEAKIIWELKIKPDEEPVLPNCKVYGVSDQGRNDSVFFELNAKNHEVTFLSEYKAGDFEALDADPKATITQLFAISSKDAKNATPGMLYMLEPGLGLTEVGDTGYESVDSLSFHPNGTLFGWAKNHGLIVIDKTSAASTTKLELPYAKVEDIAWNPAGTKLYAAQGRTLWAYSPEDERIEEVCHLPKGQVEGLEMISSKLLLVSIDNDKSSVIHALDVTNNCAEVTSASLPTEEYKDVEGVAWVCPNNGLINNEPSEFPTDSPPDDGDKSQSPQEPSQVVDDGSQSISIGGGFGFF